MCWGLCETARPHPAAVSRRPDRLVGMKSKCQKIALTTRHIVPTRLTSVICQHADKLWMTIHYTAAAIVPTYAKRLTMWSAGTLTGL